MSGRIRQDGAVSTRQRWPGWVYRDGTEPDVRFSLANERTFLAWIRTAMALLAGGVAVDVVGLDVSTTLQKVLATTLLVLGILSATTAWFRWARSEHAMRHHTSLPAPGATAVLAVGVVLVGGLLIIATLW
jgi:putative membrane protein